MKCRRVYHSFVGVMLIYIIPATVVGQQRQQFLSVPRDQRVVEGSTSVIECEVSNQRGRVQWAKDAFVLGFNRTIPGYPRYEMVGDGTDGMHHLKIYNTTLTDDATYQCQVGPAEGHPPIRATGRLTVLMPPSSMKLHSGGHEEQIEINEGTEVTLECQVENAKPVAAITWFKNDQEIRLDNQKDDIRESAMEKRHNVLSKITVKLTSSDDGSHYICQAAHPALKTPLRSSVRISVLYPPGPPVITGYTEGETIRAGEERVLTCRSKGGNPLGSVRWYRDTEVVDTTDRQIRGESINEHRFVVQPKDNGASYSCEVRNKLTKKPLVASVSLSVFFPPEKVEVSGPKQARVGENVSLTCVVENSNPPSAVSWVVDGKPHLVSTTRNERSGGGGWHTVSSLSMTVPPIDHNLMFTCHATNEELGKTSVDTFVLSVLRPPQPPEIYGYNEGVGIKVGQEQGLSCVSKGGNPPAHLQWYRNGVKIPSEKHSVAEVSSAKITLKAQPHDNKAQFRCEAHNAAASRPLSVSTTIVVHFPPERVNVSVHPEDLRDGNQATLTCVAGPSNPPVQISWFRGGFMMKGHLQDTQLSNHGSTVTDVLVLNLTSSDDGLTYSCEALNPALQTKTKSSLHLSVSYKPQFLSPPPKMVDVVLGMSMSLNLTAKANPDTVSYSWSHRGLPIPRAVVEEHRRREGYASQYRPSIDPRGARFTADGAVLNVRNVSVTDTGDVELEASNQLGKTVAKVYLNVQYGATIKGTASKVSVPLGEDATLECQANGNPLRESMMKWKRKDYSFSSTEQKFSRKKAVLRVLRVGRNDTGVFTCVANNGIGNEATANVTLIVNAKPLVLRSKLLSVSAAKEEATGLLRCEAEGAPDVEFTWRKDGKVLTGSLHHGKYHNETSKNGLVTFSSTLEIRRVTKRDYGHYDCVASNILGFSTTTIHFSEPRRPHPPLSLKVVNTTHDSVTLQWMPGFDGGAPQHFRLRYRTKGQSSPYSFADVFEPGVTTYTVTGLRLGTEYYFSIMSRNELGNSDYGAEFVRAVTSSEAPPTPVPSSNVGREVGGAPLPALWVVIVVLVATALLALNVSAIVCIIRRRRRKRGAAAGSKKFLQPPKSILQREPSIPMAGVSSHPSFGETTSNKDEAVLLNQLLDERGHVPQLVIVIVAIVGTSVVIVNIALVICLVRKKSAKRRDDGSDLASSKSTSNTMYAPSSYNDTVVGETLSSISEKSRESYSQDDSVGEYEEQQHKHAASAYLIDQIEPPPEYASQTPSSQPSSAAYDPNEDDYAEVLRRNAYNHQLGKTTPRPPSRATHYSTSPDSRGYISYSYTPSPTGVPNGAAQYHVGPQHPSVSLGLQEGSVYPGEPLNVEALESQQNAIHSLGLDTQPPPTMGLEQHSLPSDHPSLTLDPNSITIDHPILTDLTRNGDLRGTAPTLSTFHPNPSPSTYSESELEGHLV